MVILPSYRRGFRFVVPLLVCVFLGARGRAHADGRATGAAAVSEVEGNSPSRPTPYSVPGYVAPADPAHPTPQEMRAERLVANGHATAEAASRGYYAINFVWTLLAGFLVMFMQAGFALLETGLCRAKNAGHTMAMNLLVYPLCVTAFFACGYALMCGGVSASRPGGPGTLGGAPTLDGMVTIGQWGLMGKTGFFLSGKADDAGAVVWFFYMLVFLDTSATVPTGALAERWRFKSFFILSLCVGAFIYPIYGCWMWGGGWLAQLGRLGGLGHGGVDYAGSGVVHMQGGVIALVTAWMLGPRLGKYDEAGKPRPIFGHHMPMVILGTFVLAFGWFGFNAGSSLAGSTGRIGLIAVNTMLASAGGALLSCLYMWKRFGKPDPSMVCSGMLAGLVSITASCAFVQPGAAFFIGAVAGLLGAWGVMFVERRGLDDPAGAISVHGLNGLWGVLAVGLFADGTFGQGFNAVHLMARGEASLFGWSSVAAYDPAAGPPPEGFREIGVTGLLYGHGTQLLAQSLCALTCFAWNFGAAGLTFKAIGWHLGSNRVPPEVEIAGLDIPEMGAPGYPEFITAVAPENVPASEVFAARNRAGSRVG